VSEFISFLLVITSGLFFSGVFRKFHIPYVTALIIAGIVIGPFGLSLFEITPAITLIGSVGAIFLMFMAGLEVHVKNVKDISKSTWELTVLNSVIPFLTAVVIGSYFGFDIVSSAVLGIIFISSSIAVIIPQLEKTGLLHKKLGKTILSSAIFEDLTSLLLISLVLQSFSPKTDLPVFAYFLVIIISIVVMKFAFPRAREFFTWLSSGTDSFESELRYLFIILIGSAAYFEAIGMHEIVAGFIVGMLLSESIKHKQVILKLRTISYGLFIPTFFVIIGAQMNLPALFQSTEAILFTAVLVMGLIVSKVVSGFIAGRLANFSKEESLVMGIATTPQLSTTLATAFAAKEFGLLNDTIIAGLISLTVITAVFSPLALNFAVGRLKKSQEEDKSS